MLDTVNRTIDESMQECIQNRIECHTICMQMLAYCLAMGGKYAMQKEALMDCVESCATSANFMLRSSELHSQMCAICAEACGRCANSCEQFYNDEHMKACAEICRRCAESSREMMGMKM